MLSLFSVPAHTRGEKNHSETDSFNKVRMKQLDFNKALHLRLTAGEKKDDHS